MGNCEIVVTKNIEITVRCKVTGFEPERPAPVCSNPDSPLFSDPGDPGLVEYEPFFVITETSYKDGKEVVTEKEIPINNTELENYIDDQLYDEIYNEVAKESIDAHAEKEILDTDY